MTCPMCRDVRWVLDTKPRVEPLGLEPALSSARLPLVRPGDGVLSVDGRFRDVVRHPKDGPAMSLAGFTDPGQK